MSVWVLRLIVWLLDLWQRKDALSVSVWALGVLVIVRKPSSACVQRQEVCRANYPDDARIVMKFELINVAR